VVVATAVVLMELAVVDTVVLVMELQAVDILQEVMELLVGILNQPPLMGVAPLMVEEDILDQLEVDIQDQPEEDILPQQKHMEVVIHMEVVPKNLMEGEPLMEHQVVDIVLEVMEVALMVVTELKNNQKHIHLPLLMIIHHFNTMMVFLQNLQSNKKSRNHHKINNQKKGQRLMMTFIINIHI